MSGSFVEPFRCFNEILWHAFPALPRSETPLRKAAAQTGDPLVATAWR
jgi:hypothetical protein